MVDHSFVYLPFGGINMTHYVGMMRPLKPLTSALSMMTEPFALSARLRRNLWPLLSC